MVFRPKILDTLKQYDRKQFEQDLWSGIIVGIVALPLAIAFAIASGVPPEKGLFTAVVAGFIISALGGSRVQIGGPTGAFIVIVYGIVQQHGVGGLIIATFMAGIILILLGLARMGTVIKFIPYPLITGFTSGIALIIFLSQLNDLFGWQIRNMPAEFISKIEMYISHAASVNWYAAVMAGSTILLISWWPKISRKIPGSLVAIVLVTVVAQVMHLPVETIGSRFGNIPSALPIPEFPAIDLSTVKDLLLPAFSIALLGGIESLLSAVVADGMTGGNHRSDTELIAQGTANIFSSVFGGIPATGAIARTVTNIKNGGRTPVAGMIHALTLLLIMIFVGQWASLIPMAVLAGVLIVVAYNMSEWENFLSLLKGPRSDAIVLLTAFLLTVLFDLTIAIMISMVLASFLFMRKMVRFTDVNMMSGSAEADESKPDRDSISNYVIPSGVEVFEISGPLFFGAAYKFKDAIRLIEKPPRLLVIRMRQVPIIDATGLRVLQEVNNECRRNGTKLVLTEVFSKQVNESLQNSNLLLAIEKVIVTNNMDDALQQCHLVLNVKN